MNRLRKIGRIKTLAATEVKESRLGIGFEKLDRGLFDPEKAYDLVAALGVKWARVQSGWARTETRKGEYDFAWFDSIIDNLCRRGLQPWVCLCYGNGLYSPKAQEVFGAVGVPPIFTPEERAGWHNYVAALTARYAGKVQWYEVWNEPDGIWCWKHGVNATEYGEFVKATAAAIKAGDPTAKVIGGSSCMASMQWLSEMLDTGAAAAMDGFTYHAYAAQETDFNRLEAQRALVRSRNPRIEIIQGETGAQSREGGHGALWEFAWTPELQAKFLARHLTADMLGDVKFASYFSCMDMAEALNGKPDDVNSCSDFGYFGVLGAEFDAAGRATGIYTPKPSYRALQTLAAVFHGRFSRAELPLRLFSAATNRFGYDRHEFEACDLLHGAFVRPNGTSALAYWRAADLMTESVRGMVSLAAAVPGEPRLLDALTGELYAFPPEMVEDQGHGVRLFHHLPVLDSPLLLLFGDFEKNA